jgi:hypothetical protein
MDGIKNGCRGINAGVRNYFIVPFPSGMIDTRL